jgi:hypothetical protein
MHHYSLVVFTITMLPEKVFALIQSVDKVDIVQDNAMSPRVSVTENSLTFLHSQQRGKCIRATLALPFATDRWEGVVTPVSSSGTKNNLPMKKETTSEARTTAKRCEDNCSPDSSLTTTNSIAELRKPASGRVGLAKSYWQQDETRSSLHLPPRKPTRKGSIDTKDFLDQALQMTLPTHDPMP